MHAPPDPFQSAIDFWRRAGNLAELWWTRHGGLASADLAGERLRSLVEHAREHSPFYRRKFSLCPGPGTGCLPSVTKAELMAHFDTWCTDPEVRRESVERFLADRGRVGEQFLGRYTVWKSSGTSGTPGIFIQDAAALAVYDALVASQWDDAALGAQAMARVVASGGRAALVVATGDHFASITSWEHQRRGLSGTAARSFSVLDPLPRLVAELNEFDPAFLASYPSVLTLLAAEREAGRLRVAPALLWSGGETLGRSAHAAIEEAFDCRVMNEYGASECLSIAYECTEGHMHLNSEWVIVEGVDDKARPTPPGELSHTVLLTNLANWVQPIIRYDIGDRIQMLTAPCACGNPHPAMRIEGRTDAVVVLATRAGQAVRLAPLALSTVVEEAAGEHRFQIARAAPDHLLVRFDASGGPERARTWRLAHDALRRYLAAQSLANVRVSLDRAPPRLDPRSGKLRSVIVESHENHASSRTLTRVNPPRRHALSLGRRTRGDAR